MKASICTLFEGDYHYGLGVLVNSLYAQGYRGTIWVGYRGALPPWATLARSLPSGSEFPVAEGCTIRFIRLETTAHLTNIKPDFMLEVLDRHEPDCDGLFYMDPDIVVVEQWRTFEEWITCGIAVCEDVNSPLSQHHPRRIGWRRCFAKFGIILKPRESGYANGGFVGVARENRAFLVTWKTIQDAMWTVVGGAEFAAVPGGKDIEGQNGFFDCFGRTDQDALNATIEAAVEVPVSFLGRQAMGFEGGSPLLPHAVGRRKPWQGGIIRNALRGYGCPQTDRHFWRFVERPIRVCPNAIARWRRLQMRIAAAIGRFYRRS